MLLSQRVFQNDSLPLRKARLTPASRAAVTLLRCPPDQYSWWPTERNALWFLMTAADGTAHDAETDQLPASTRPVALSVRGAGWICRVICAAGRVATRRAPLPW